MVVTLDEDLNHEEQKLFGELYDTKGHRLSYCRWCGHWCVYLIRDEQGAVTLHNFEDDSIHCCANMQSIKGERTF